MHSEGAETYLRGLAEAELRRRHDGAIDPLYGAFSGAVELDYPDGPCIWLRDDTGQWHAAAPGNWTGDEVTVFAADVVPPIEPPVSSADILIVSRTADLRARVPLTWWTS